MLQMSEIFPYLSKGQILASTKEWVRGAEEWLNLLPDRSNPLSAFHLLLLVAFRAEHAKHEAADLGVPCVDEEVETRAE